MNESRVSEKEDALKRVKEQHESERKVRDGETQALVSELEQLKLSNKCDLVRLEDRLAEANDTVLQWVYLTCWIAVIVCVLWAYQVLPKVEPQYFWQIILILL